MNVNSYPCEEYSGDFEKHEDKCRRDCSKIGEQILDISLPIEICPEADLGKIETECCGKPCIECEQEPCGATCSIIITQSVKIKIPVKFGVKTIEGNSFIKCCDKHCED